MFPHTAQLGDPAFTGGMATLRPSNGSLYRNSPIGGTSPLVNMLKVYLSAAYQWMLDCYSMLWTSVQQRADAKNSEDGERRSALYAERPDRRRESSRVGSVNWIRTEEYPHCLGFERSDSCGSRRCKFSRTLRIGQHQADELPAIHTRMDCARKSLKMTSSAIWKRFSKVKLACAGDHHEPN
jgi:hypothetical protein